MALKAVYLEFLGMLGAQKRIESAFLALSYQRRDLFELRALKWRLSCRFGVFGHVRSRKAS